MSGPLRSRILRSPLWSVLQKRCEVDDVLQETWARALQPMQVRYEHRGPGSLLIYVTAIAEHVLGDMLRRVMARKHGDPTQLATGQEPPASLPLRAACATPTSEARAGEILATARRVLDEAELAAWELVEIEGYTAEEAGEVLGRSGAAVRGLMFRSRRRLMRVVAGYDEG